MFSDETHNEDEDYLFESSASSLKKGFFLSMTPLISEEYFNYLFKLLFLLIHTLQLISFSFKIPLIYYWKSPTSVDSVANFFSYFMLMPYFQNSSFSLFLAFFYIISGFNLVFFIILLYLNLVAEGQKTRNFNQNTAIFQFARILCEILPYVLYLPMFEVLIAIFNCSFDSKTAQWLHNQFIGVVCYENLYFMHIFIGGLAMVFQVFITAAITLLFFEPRLKSHHFFSKLNGKIDFLAFLYKTLLVIIFSTLSGYSDIVLMAYLTLLPFFLFLRFREDFPFFNLLASKAHLLHYAWITWTGFMVVFGKIVWEIDFDANIYIFFFGLGLLWAIILLRREFRYDLLLININKNDSIEAFEKHIQYILLLCENYKADPAINILLDGFVQFHKTICADLDCPCKKDQSVLRKTRKNQEFSSNDTQILRVFSLINVFFVNMLQKTPFKSSLRIKYSLFLLDKMNQKQLALQEILSAAKYKPTLEEEFLIFRFKRIIEAELLEKKKEDSYNLQGFAMETVNELALNSIVKQLKANIEKSASQHMEFWSQLSEDVPDLSKLAEIGNRINVLDGLLEEDWERFIRMNVMLPSLYRLFAYFLFTIFFDKQGSAKIYNKLDDDALKGTLQSAKNMLAAEFVNNSTPVVFMSGEEATLGVIINLNQAAAGLFGYNKSELLNKKLTIIQPASIAEKHDAFVENYLMKNETRMLNKEILLPVKDKNGYLKPMFISAKSLPFAMQGLQFFALFRLEKTFKTYMYIYCDADGTIELFSTSCLHFLNLDKKKLAKRKNSIVEIIPGFFDNLKNFINKNGGLVDVQIQAKVAYTLTNYTTTMPATLNNMGSNVKDFNPHSGINSKDNLENNDIKSGSNFDIDQSEDVIKPGNLDDKNAILPIKMPVFVQNFENAQFSLKNYLVKIEYREKMFHKLPAPHKLKIPSTNNKHPIFSLRYDIYSNVYKGELLEGESREIDDYLNFLQSSQLSGRSVLENNNDFLMADSKSDSVRENSRIFKKLEENMLLKQKEINNTAAYEWKDWGKGIKTYRLLGDRTYDLEELKREDESNEGSEENIQESNNEKDKKNDEKSGSSFEKDESALNLKNSRNIFKNRSNFVSFLKRLKSEKSSFVRNLHFFAVMSLILVGIVSSVNHFIMANQFSMNENSYELIDWADERISEAQLILYDITELQLMSLGIYNNSMNFYNQSYEGQIKAQLVASITTLESLQNDLVLNSFGLNSQHIQLTQENTIKTAYISSNGEISSQYFDINQITSQIISKAYDMSSKPLSSFINDTLDSDFFFLKYNLLNDYYLALKLESSLFLSELNDRVVENSTILLVMILLSAIVLFISLFLLVPLYSSALTSHHELLSIFLDISVGQVKRNFSKCESFLNLLQVGEEEEEAENDNGENSDEDIVKDEENPPHEGFIGLMNSKKRKKFKLNNRNKLLFCSKVFIILCIIEAFFIANYSITSIFSNDIDSIVNELNVTSIAESHYSFANNLIRQNIMNPNFNVTAQSNYSTILLQTYTDLLISLVSSIEKLHSLNLGNQDPSYNSIFDQVFSMDICQLLFVNQGEDCENFADGSLTQGLSLAFYRFIDNFRENDGYITLIREGILTNLSTIGNGTENFMNGMGNNNLLTLDIQRENNVLQTEYFKIILRFLMEQQLDTMKSTYATTMNNRLTLYVCFVILLMLIYVFFWLPIVGQLNLNLYKIKRMLAIIPLEIIQNNKNIRENIQSFLNIHD